MSRRFVEKHGVSVTKKRTMVGIFCRISLARHESHKIALRFGRKRSWTKKKQTAIRTIFSAIRPVFPVSKPRKPIFNQNYQIRLLFSLQNQQSPGERLGHLFILEFIHKMQGVKRQKNAPGRCREARLWFEQFEAGNVDVSTAGFDKPTLREAAQHLRDGKARFV